MNNQELDNKRLTTIKSVPITFFNVENRENNEDCIITSFLN